MVENVSEFDLPAPAPIEPDTPAPVEDSSPVLAGVAPEFTPENADPTLDGMPEIRSFAHELPSARLKVQKSLVAIKAAFPESLTGEESEINAENLTPEDFEKLTNAVEKIEEFVINIAKNPNDMREWLINHKDPETALFAAFSEISERLGK
ncbi:hypothetical protein GP475_08760 [Corynebacterium poyangense]|uniref:Uncharacterized protein n=1 Tax=Corynebacterium poyangense TaxID=2684405 RepID=A0A7H0SQ92_9CORY|nr:hypothetical protein [Corynebacterium poyangense]QNQ90717.1 hypothetical protein GP475_08760 [Corynebacterium poyangense]